jgi:hypothetical protein
MKNENIKFVKSDYAIDIIKNNKKIGEIIKNNVNKRFPYSVDFVDGRRFVSKGGYDIFSSLKTIKDTINDELL